MKFEDWDRMRKFGKEQTMPEEVCTKCKKCGFEFFESIRVKRIHAYQPIVPGQEPIGIPGEETFVMLRCCNCMNIQEPNVTPGGQGFVRTQYYAFLDALDAAKIILEKKEKEKINKKIKSEEI